MNDAIYKHMPDELFKYLTITLFATMVAMSLLISDMTMLMEFTGGICGNCLIFIFPAFFFLYSDNKME